MVNKNYKELYLDVKKSYEELKILNGIITEITQSSDLNRVFKSTINTVLRYVGFESASLLTINEPQEELVLHSHVGHPPEYILRISSYRFKKGMCFVGLAWEHSAPIYIL